MDTEISSSTADEAVVDSGGRRHTVWVYLLIVLGAVILLVTTVGVWVDRQVLDTDNWVDTSDELLADPEIRSAIATFVVGELYANVDVAEQLNGLLPGDFSGLAGVLATSLRAPATEAVDRLLATPQAAEVWSQANRRAHETMVNILENETVPAVDTANGTVTLDLRQLVITLADTFGLPGAVVQNIPEDAGKVTIIESQELENLQTAVTIVQWASVLLFILILVIYAGAIALARGWRREATRAVGISVFIVGLLVTAGLRFGGDILIDSVVKNKENSNVADAVWKIGSELLRDLGVNLIVIGLVLFLGAVLAGPSRAATAVRRFIAPAFVGGAGIRWVIFGVVFLALVLWAPLPILNTWVGVLAAAGVVAACVEGLRRACLADRAAVDAAAGDEADTDSDAEPQTVDA
jgi:hypothetical protein